MLKRQKTKQILVVTALMATFCIHAQGINFADAWQLLQNKNNSLAAQRANVQRYTQLEDADNALNYPKITLRANYTRLDDDIDLSLSSLDLSATAAATLSALGLPSSMTVTEKDMLTSSVQVLWPIYTGGKISAAQSYASGKKDEAIAQLKTETQSRYEDLGRYYFSAVLAKNVLDTRQSVEKALSQHRDFAIKLEQQGQIAKVERLQADASLAKAIVDRKKAQRDLDIAITALTEILNQKEKVTPQSTLFINRTLPPLGAFTEQTLENYPGLDLLDAKDKQATSAIKAEQSKYYPNVYLYGDYVVYQDDSLLSESTPDWFAGIGISIPLIDNSGRSEKVQAAHSAKLQINHLRQQARQDLTVLVEKTYFSAEQAIEEVEGLDSSLALAQENFRLRKKSFNQGLSTSLDVIDARLYLANIKTQQQIARFNYIIALNKLLALSSETSTFSQYEQTAFQSSTLKDK